MTGPLPGTLLRHQPVDTGITGARAWRVHYTSRDVKHLEHESSGLVIAPTGGGENRPILTWCHGTCPGLADDTARLTDRTENYFRSVIRSVGRWSWDAAHDASILSASEVGVPAAAV